MLDKIYNNNNNKKLKMLQKIKLKITKYKIKIINKNNKKNLRITKIKRINKQLIIIKIYIRSHRHKIQNKFLIKKK